MVVETLMIMGVACSVFGARRHRVRRRFLKQHKKEVEAEMDALGEAFWLSGGPEKKLRIERRIKPAEWLAPTITFRRTFRRDPWPWYAFFMEGLSSEHAPPCRLWTSPS